MSDFKTNNKIVLQPADANITYRFSFPINTSATSGDGNLPYGTTISGIAVSTKTESGTTTTGIIDSSAISGDDAVNVVMSYPTVAGEGRYHMTFVLTLSDGSTHERNFNRIEAIDL